jgi:hypothetical protein
VAHGGAHLGPPRPQDDPTSGETSPSASELQALGGSNRDQASEQVEAGKQQARENRKQRRREKRLERQDERGVLGKAANPAISIVEGAIPDEVEPDSFSRRGREAREEIKATREAAAESAEGPVQKAGAQVAEFIGAETKSEARTAATINVALAPVSAPAGALGRAGAKAGAKAGARAAAKRGGREAAEEGLETLGRKAGREAGEEGGESLARSAGRASSSPSRAGGLRGAARRGGSQGGQEAAEEASEGLVSRTGKTITEAAEEADAAIGRVGTGKAAAGALGGGVIAGAAYDLATEGDGSDDQGDGQSDRGDAPDYIGPDGPQDGRNDNGGNEPGNGPGSGPFEPTGAGPLSLGVLDRIGGGLGAGLDQVGGGIADALRGLGVPIGKGAGKAIAIGGTLLLVAYAIRTGVGPFAGSLDLGSSSEASGGGLPSGVARGPDGKFVSS